MDENLAEITKRAVKEAGGPAAVGRLCAVSAQAVSQWTQVPAPHVNKVAEASNVARSTLRPDLYPPNAERDQPEIPAPKAAEDEAGKAA